MHILVAPDKFKGSLSAREVAENIASGLHDILPDVEIDIVPLADGGEGTAEVISDALGGNWVNCRAHDPLGREIQARYVMIDSKKLAIMEMSEAAGMRRLQPNDRDIDLASTFGVGQMIRDATLRGAGEIIIGLGGSATNDGGFGMARALGFRFFSGEKELSGAMSDLQKLTRIARPSPGASRPPWDRDRAERREDGGEGNSSSVVYRWLPKITAAADVRNPLLGENGATRVFGPQKGATEEKIDILERALTRLADVVANEFGFDFRNEPGAGAAGGLGFGLMSFCGANIRPGFEVVAEAVDLKSKIKNVDVVITGEGSLDRQTLQGKAPAEVAKLAREHGKRAFAIVGRASEDRQVGELFDGIYELARAGTSDQDSITRAPGLLRERARELAKALL